MYARNSRRSIWILSKRDPIYKIKTLQTNYWPDPKLSKIELKTGKLSLDGVVPIIAVLRALPNHGRVTTELVNSNKKKPLDSREEMLFSKNRKERRCQVGTYGVWSLKWSACCPASDCGRRLMREVECGLKASLRKDYISLFFIISTLSVGWC